MYTLIEFHGRLSRSDKRPANPGRYDLQFQLHPSADGNATLWSESLKGVDVAPGGFYYVTLGQRSSLSASLFANGPRWLSVRVVAGGKRSEEHSSRVPVLGQIVCLGDLVHQLEGRVQQIEGALQGINPRGSRREGGVPPLREWAEDLADRVRTLEEQGGGAPGGQIEQLLLRLDAIDGEEGRLTRIEDELDDIVGTDGDLIDLNERMDLLEERAPDLIANLRAREGETGRERMNQMEDALRALRERLVDMDRTVVELRAAIQKLHEAPLPAPEAIGAVRKSGDTLSGPLTIQRGGLDVHSGAITARSAEIASLESATQVKTARLVTDALDLRGDLLVDSAKRVLQVRSVEGRHSSGKRDGPLHLNTRGGAEVVVGNAEQRKGMDVFGPIAADTASVRSGVVAQVFRGGAALSAGDVVAVDAADAGRVAHPGGAADRGVVGVVCDAAGLVLGGPLGSGSVAVALYGVVSARAEAESAPIRPGDSLISSAVAGHARACGDLAADAGAILGKALEGLESGRGTIRVLLSAR